MMEVLILFALIKKELTMYGISKYIESHFDAYTKPSFGAIKPALKRLERSGFIRSRKSLSEGGKQSGFYNITEDGLLELRKLILEDVSQNPLQFFSSARIKLACASYLTIDERKVLFYGLKTRAAEHKFSAENILNNEYISLTFYERVVMDNSVCEYQNFINLVENLEKENERSSQ